MANNMATNDWEKYIQDAMSRWDWNALAKMKEEWGAKQWQEFVKHIKNETIDECLAAVGKDNAEPDSMYCACDGECFAECIASMNKAKQEIRIKLEGLKESNNG